MDLFKREADGYSIKEVDQFVKKAHQKIYDLQQNLDFYTNSTNGCELKEREKDLVRRTVILDKIFNKLFLLVKSKLGKEETEVFLDLCRNLDKITKGDNVEEQDVRCNCEEEVISAESNGEPLINLEDVYHPDESLDEMCKGLNFSQNSK